MNALLSLLSALFMTLLLEVPLGVLILKKQEVFIPLCLINILTNPALNAALMLLLAFTKSYTVYYIALAIGELAVFIGEGFLIRMMLGLPLKRSIILSTILNSVSLFLGRAMLTCSQL